MSSKYSKLNTELRHENSCSKMCEMTVLLVLLLLFTIL